MTLRRRPHIAALLLATCVIAAAPAAHADDSALEPIGMAFGVSLVGGIVADGLMGARLARHERGEVVFGLGLGFGIVDLLGGGLAVGFGAAEDDELGVVLCSIGAVALAVGVVSVVLGLVGTLGDRGVRVPGRLRRTTDPTRPPTAVRPG
jgi:hypothetical protein